MPGTPTTGHFGHPKRHHTWPRRCKKKTANIRDGLLIQFHQYQAGPKCLSEFFFPHFSPLEARQHRSGSAQQGSPVVISAFPTAWASPFLASSSSLESNRSPLLPPAALIPSQTHYPTTITGTLPAYSMVALSSSFGSSRRGVTAARAAPVGVACGALLASYLLLQTDDANEDDRDEHPTHHQHQQPQQPRPSLLNLLLRPMPADCFFFKNKSSNQDTGTPTTPTSTANVVINPAPFESVYELGPQLGTGAFATVYKCTQKTKPKRSAAVKVFDLSKVPPEKQARIREGINEVNMKK